MNRQGWRTPATGMTFIELALALTIVMVVAAFGGGAWSDIIWRLRADAAVQEAMRAAELARSAALSAQRTVTWCSEAPIKPLTSDEEKDENAKKARRGECDSLWRVGANWIIFYDDNKNGVLEKTEVIIEHIATPVAEAKINWSGFTGKPYVIFGPPNQTQYSNGTLTYCPPAEQAKTLKQVVINRIGRPRSQTVEAGAVSDTFEKRCGA